MSLTLNFITKIPFFQFGIVCKRSRGSLLPILIFVQSNCGPSCRFSCDLRTKIRGLFKSSIFASNSTGNLFVNPNNACPRSARAVFRNFWYSASSDNVWALIRFFNEFFSSLENISNEAVNKKIECVGRVSCQHSVDNSKWPPRSENELAKIEPKS